MDTAKRSAMAGLLAVLGLALVACGPRQVVSSTAQPASPPSSSAVSTTDSSVPTSGGPVVVGDPTTTTPTSSSTPTTTAPTTTTTPAPKPKPKPVVVTAVPAFDKPAAPGQPLTLKAAGKITALTVKAEDGSDIAGTFSADRSTWTSTQRLRYGGSYVASGTAEGGPGTKPTSISGTWSVQNAEEVSVSVSPNEGAVRGVAAVVIVRFGYYATDEQKAEIVKRLKVTGTRKIVGAWAWIRHDGEDYDSLDFRPEGFWPEDTTVTVTVDLFGLPFADGLYGPRDAIVRKFTIGRNQVVYADPQSKMMTVKRDGKVVAKYPTSMGRGDDVGDPNLVTRSGIHVVTDKQAVVKMSNPEYNYRDLPEKWAVRISNNGEFIHQNMASYDVQGKQNVSHGCLNLSDVNAEAYFNTAMLGDPVVITGTSIKLGPADGDLYDWAIPWSQWLTMG